MTVSHYLSEKDKGTVEGSIIRPFTFLVQINPKMIVVRKQNAVFLSFFYVVSTSKKPGRGPTKRVKFYTESVLRVFSWHSGKSHVKSEGDEER